MGREGQSHNEGENYFAPADSVDENSDEWVRDQEEMRRLLAQQEEEDKKARSSTPPNAAGRRDYVQSRQSNTPEAEVGRPENPKKEISNKPAIQRYLEELGLEVGRTYNYYQFLGVQREVTEKEIKSTYRRLARKYHPDVNPGDNTAKRVLQYLSEAYGVLSDPKKRAIYDRYSTMSQGVNRGPQDRNRRSRESGGEKNSRDFEKASAELLSLVQRDFLPKTITDYIRGWKSAGVDLSPVLESEQVRTILTQHLQNKVQRNFLAKTITDYISSWKSAGVDLSDSINRK